MKRAFIFLVALTCYGQRMSVNPTTGQLDIISPTTWLNTGIGVLASRPATCTQGQFYICVGAGCTDGNNIHYCRATNTWEVQGVAAGSGITTLNTLNGAAQTFAVGTAGTDFAISSATTTHTFNLPTASGTNRGALSSADWTTFNGKIGGTLSANRVPFASGASTLTDSANFRFTTDVSFDRLYIAADGVSGFQLKRAAGANTLQLRRHDDAAMGVLEVGILRSKDDSTNDRFVVDPGAATVTIPGSYLDMTGGTMGWPSTTVASLPAAASNTGKVYVVTDASTSGNCTTGGGTERAICRSNGSAWQNLGDGGTGGSGCVPSGADNQILTDSGAGACTSEGQWTIATNVLTSGASGKVDLSAASGTDGFKFPVAAGAAPTVDGACSFDSTANAYKCGESGTTYTMWSVAVGTGLSAADSGAQRTVSVDTATVATWDPIQRNTALYLNDQGASDAYSAASTPTPTGSIATGSVWTPRFNTANTGASTLDVDAGGALAAVAIKYANGSTDTATGDILAGDFAQLIFDGTAMRLPPVIVNSGNVRGKLPLANLTAPSAGQYIYSSDGVTASSRQPLFSDLSGNASANQLGSSVNAQTGTTYTILNGDRGKLVTHTNAGSIAVTLPQAGSGGNFANDWFYCTQNRGAGTVTITPTTSTIDGAASLALTTNQGTCVWSDATNYFTMRGAGGGGITGSLTSGRIPYATGASTLADSANLLWDNTNATVTIGGSSVGKLYLKNASNQIEVSVSDCDAGNTVCFAQNYKMAWSGAGSGVLSADVGIARSAAGVLNIHDGSATITNYRDLKLRELVVTTGTEGTCDSTNRGRIVFVAGGAGVADTYRICRKDGGDAYAFVALF